MWQLLIMIWCPPLDHPLCHYAMQPPWHFATEAKCQEDLRFMIANKPGLFYHGWCKKS